MVIIDKAANGLWKALSDIPYPIWIAIAGQIIYLVAWSAHIDDHVARIDREQEIQDKRIEQVNTRIGQLFETGTSQIGVINERQKTMSETLARGNDRLIALEKSANQIDIIKNDMVRITEQQSRIIQALDNVYNSVQELARDRPLSRKPTPGTNGGAVGPP